MQEESAELIHFMTHNLESWGMHNISRHNSQIRYRIEYLIPSYVLVIQPQFLFFCIGELM